MSAPIHNSCTKLRRMLIRRGTLNINTGESKMDEGTMETRACGVPLFSDAERQSGTCRSCESGWTSPENHPVESNS